MAEGLKWRVNRAVRASDLAAPARLIMFVLSDMADSRTAEIPEGRTPSLAELASDTGLNVATVKRHLGDLDKAGWVIRSRPSAEEKARHVSTRYRLAIPSDGAQCAIEEVDPMAHEEPSELDPMARCAPSDGAESAIAMAHCAPSSHIDDRYDQLHNQELPATSAATAPEPKPAKPSKHETADALAARFWEIHKSSTAQPFLAIRGIIRTAIANGIPRDDVARALDRLVREQRAISGGTITTALGQIRGTPTAASFRRPSNDSGLAAAMERARAAELAQAQAAQPARRELTA